MNIKYPHINVELVGQDGNALSIIGRTTRAMKNAGLPLSDIEDFQTEAMSGDYNHLLQTVMKWVSTDSSPEEDEDDYDDWDYEEEEYWDDDEEEEEVY
jgi:hypothetical protein